MRVPRIAGVDLSWALSLVFVLPTLVFVNLSKAADGFDAYNFELITDFFFALMFFAHGVSAGALLQSVSSNDRVNRFLVTQGVLYLSVGVALEMFHAVNFLMALGVYFLVGRVVIYLDNQIVRFMIVLLVVTGIFLYSFGQSDVLTDQIAGISVIDRVIVYLAEHHFNLIYWLPIFLSGILFARSDFQSGKRQREIRLMAFLMIFFGIVLHVLGLRLFHFPTGFDSFLGFGFSISLPAFYAFSIGLCQLLTLSFERAYRKSGKKTLWSGALNAGRLHLAASVFTAVLIAVIGMFSFSAQSPYLWTALLSAPLVGMLFFLPSVRKLKDPLLFFSKVTFSKAGEDEDAQTGGRK